MVVTNALGIAFTATVLSVTDAGVTFVFPEDGATNRLAWSKLAPASQMAICEETQFAPVPPALAATFQMAQRELRRIRALSSGERLEPDVAARRRQTVREVFEAACQEQAIPKETTRLLVRRLNP